MTKEIRSPNVQMLRVVRSPVSSFGFGNSFGFRHSSFGFENHGSWRAPTLFLARIGTMNRIRFGPRAVPARSGRAKTRAWVIFQGRLARATRCDRGPVAVLWLDGSVDPQWLVHG